MGSMSARLARSMGGSSYEGVRVLLADTWSFDHGLFLPSGKVVHGDYIDQIFFAVDISLGRIGALDVG